jgi:hypothetical protein
MAEDSIHSISCVKYIFWIPFTKFTRERSLVSMINEFPHLHVIVMVQAYLACTSDELVDISCVIEATKLNI